MSVKAATATELRALTAGDAFAIRAVLPDGWMRDAEWTIHEAVHVESAQPMTTGGARCIAHAAVLTEADDNAVLALVAIESAGEVVQLAVEPLPVSVEDEPRQQLRFVAAVQPDLDALWVSTRCVCNGDLLAMEYIYSGTARILSTVGADPASSSTSPDKYAPKFVGKRFPRDFTIGQQHYEYRDGVYVFDLERSLRSR